MRRRHRRSRPVLRSSAPIRPPSSVKVGEMDAEHEMCVTALSQLERQRDLTALDAVLSAYRMPSSTRSSCSISTCTLLRSRAAARGRGGGGGFSVAASARASHFRDHERCSTTPGVRSTLAAKVAAGHAGARVPAAGVDATLRAFETHADKYDGGYAEALSQALAAAEVAAELQ